MAPRKALAATPTLPQALGEQVRKLREAAGKRQDDVAEAAAEFGLPWAPSSVASLELGRRQLSAAEFVLLPAILARALQATVGMDDLLLGITGVVWLTEQSNVVGGAPILELLRGPAPRGSGVGGGQGGPVDRWAATQLGMSETELVEHCIALWGRTFKQERDARVAETTGDKRRLQAMRGHVTRAMMRELTAAVMLARATPPKKSPARRSKNGDTDGSR